MDQARKSPEILSSWSVKCKSKVTGDKSRKKVKSFQERLSAKRVGLYAVSTRGLTRGFKPRKVWSDHLEAVAMSSKRRTFK